MYYIDTDVLVHSLVNQFPKLHIQITALLSQFATDNNLFISWLSIQETAFVLAKLGQPTATIVSRINFLTELQPSQYGLPEFIRATELAKVVGFKSINDCLHVAIAEQHCTDLYTCNYKDFTQLEPHTHLNIHFIK